MKSKKFKILLSIPLGGIGGFFTGLVTTSFIPLCCGDGGCHNCFEIAGMSGYVALGVSGFFIGLFLTPIVYTLLLLKSERNSHRRLKQ